jgi:hypothetical protein
MERKKVSAIPYFWVLYCLSLFSSVSFLPLAPAIPSLSLSLGHLAHKRKLWSCRGGGAGGSGGGERRPSERRNLRAKGMGLPGTYGLSFYSLSLITALSLSSDFFPFPESSQLSLSLSLSLSFRCLFSYSPSSSFNCVLTVHRLSFLWVMTNFVYGYFVSLQKMEFWLERQSGFVWPAVSFNQLNLIIIKNI